MFPYVMYLFLSFSISLTQASYNNHEPGYTLWLLPENRRTHFITFRFFPWVFTHWLRFVSEI